MMQAVLLAFRLGKQVTLFFYFIGNDEWDAVVVGIVRNVYNCRSIYCFRLLAS